MKDSHDSNGRLNGLDTLRAIAISMRMCLLVGLGMHYAIERPSNALRNRVLELERERVVDLPEAVPEK